jgi:hypothetical protein
MQVAEKLDWKGLIVSNWEQQMAGILSYSMPVTSSCPSNFCANWFVLCRSKV